MQLQCHQVPLSALHKLENQEAGDHSVQARKTMSSSIQGWEEMGVLGKYLGEKKNSKIVMKVCDSCWKPVSL